MAVMDAGAPMGTSPRAMVPTTAPVLTFLGAAAAIVLLALYLFSPTTLDAIWVTQSTDIVGLSLYAAAILFIAAGGVLMIVRPGLGGSTALVGVFGWLFGCIACKDFGYALAVPVVLAGLGALTALISNDHQRSRSDTRLIFKQTGWTRVTHWIWAVAMFFLLLSGLQIFNSRPNLYIGQQSGFQFDNSILDFGLSGDGEARPQVRIFGQLFDDKGYQGPSGVPPHSNYQAITSWATIPSYHDLGAGRVVHFFFAWILVSTLFVWLVSALVTGHFWRDIVLKPRDIRGIPKDIVDHVKLRFAHGKSYSPLQKLAYFVVFVILFPLIISTGLTMSPGMDTALPWLLDLFGGRQTARTIHFLTMSTLVLFFIVHIIMVVLANPVNELRSMITGYYKSGHGAAPGSSEKDH